MSATITAAVIAATISSGAAYLGIVIVPQAPGALAGVGVLLAVAAAFLLSARNSIVRRSTCPRCRGLIELDHHEKRSNGLTICPQCWALLAAQKEVVVLQSDDMVGDQNLRFGIELFGGMKFPAVCPYCGARATKVVPFVEHGFLSKAGGFVAHCDRHASTPNEITQADSAYVLWARSYRFVLGIVEANRGEMINLSPRSVTIGRPR